MTLDPPSTDVVAPTSCGLPTPDPKRRSPLRRALVALALILTAAGVTAAASGSSTPPQQPGCTAYPLNAFLGDIPELRADAGATHGTALPPCTEAVSFAAQDAGPEGLVSLFGASKTQLERLQNGFDLYSWMTFVALNQPADTTQQFGASNARTLWESAPSPEKEPLVPSGVLPFYPVDRVMQIEASDAGPGPFVLPAECRAAPSDGGPPVLFVTQDEVGFDQPFKSGPLIDKNGMYSLNTIFLDQPMRDFITDGGLQTYEGQQKFTRLVDFEVGADGKTPLATPKPAKLGSMMLKASWRVLKAGEDDFNEFHTARAYVFRPRAMCPPDVTPSPPKCTVETLGLVGLHIVHKTINRHQWVWTTFEHVRNVPSQDDVKNHTLLDGGYSFYSADGGPPELANATPLPPWSQCEAKAPKSQIVRAQPITRDTQTINDAAHNILRNLLASDKVGPKNVWTNYQLVSTQWPADFPCASEATSTTNEQPDPNCSPAPEFLPNSTLETYVQHDIGTSGGVPQATSSCIACHNNAVSYQRLDFGNKDTEKACTNGKPGVPCSTASDFTFILEQVCAPMTGSDGGPLRDATGKQRCERD